MKNTIRRFSVKKTVIIILPILCLLYVDSSIKRMNKFKRSHIHILSEIKNKVASLDLKSQLEVVDYARKYINTNSTHNISKESKKYRFTPEKVVKIIYKRDLDKNSMSPKLTCGSRARVMKLILDDLGIENRTVHIFSDDFKGTRSHTFLEVRINKEIYIQAPDFNIYYYDTKKEKRKNNSS